MRQRGSGFVLFHCCSVAGQAIPGATLPPSRGGIRFYLYLPWGQTCRYYPYQRRRRSGFTPRRGLRI